MAGITGPTIYTGSNSLQKNQPDFIFFYLCTVHFGIYKVYTPTNAIFIKLYNVLTFTSKIILICPTFFILVINQVNVQNVCFMLSLFHASIGVMIPEAV